MHCNSRISLVYVSQLPDLEWPLIGIISEPIEFYFDNICCVADSMFS